MDARIKSGHDEMGTDSGHSDNALEAIKLRRLSYAGVGANGWCSRCHCDFDARRRFRPDWSTVKTPPFCIAGCGSNAPRDRRRRGYRVTFVGRCLQRAGARRSRLRSPRAQTDNLSTIEATVGPVPPAVFGTPD